jgi:soluble lytic murein transglycosylase
MKARYKKFVILVLSLGPYSIATNSGANGFNLKENEILLSHRRATENKLTRIELIATRFLPVQFKTHAKVIARTILSESARHRLDPLLVVSVIQTESSFNPLAKGSFGEIGLMQIKPSTAQWIAAKYNIQWKGAHSLNNPHVNIQLATAYLAYLKNRLGNDNSDFIAAYNSGPSHVLRSRSENRVPKIYINKVLGRLARFSEQNTLLATNNL